MAEDLSPALDEAARVDLFGTMVVIRMFEEAVLREARSMLRLATSAATGTARGSGASEFRLSAGREPVAVGVCAHLVDDDALTAAHRPHHLAIARGMDLHKLACEAFGNGSDSDRRNRWHLFDPDTHFTSSPSIAEGYPPALGRAFAFQQRATGRVAVAVTDRAGAEQDGFREALDLATLWSLPLVFVVEDDAWTSEEPESRAYDGSARTPTVLDYGVPSERVEYNAVESVHEAAGRAVERARAGEGPSVLEVHTVRLAEHPEPPSLPTFRSDLTGVTGVDPLPTYERALLEAGVLDDTRIQQVRTSAQEEVAEALAHARDVTGESGGEGHCPTCERRTAT